MNHFSMLIALLLVMFALQGTSKRNNEKPKISFNSHSRLVISFAECREYRPSVIST